MKEIFREADFTRIGYCQSVLESAGIPTHVRNQDLVGIMTEVPIPEFFPALCVVNEGDYERAIMVLSDHFEKDKRRAEDGDVQCGKCGEESPGNFDACWNCGEVFGD